MATLSSRACSTFLFDPSTTFQSGTSLTTHTASRSLCGTNKRTKEVPLSMTMKRKVLTLTMASFFFKPTVFPNCSFLHYAGAYQTKQSKLSASKYADIVSASQQRTTTSSTARNAAGMSLTLSSNFRRLSPRIASQTLANYEIVRAKTHKQKSTSPALCLFLPLVP